MGESLLVNGHFSYQSNKNDSPQYMYTYFWEWKNDTESLYRNCLQSQVKWDGKSWNKNKSEVKDQAALLCLPFLPNYTT